MKLFKRVDVYLQIMLVAGALIQLNFGVENIIYWYMIVGGWQLVSFLIHKLFPGSFYPAKARATYSSALLFLFLVSLFAFPLIYFYLFSLSLITPIYAALYLVVCVKENTLLEKKALIHLK